MHSPAGKGSASRQTVEKTSLNSVLMIGAGLLAVAVETSIAILVGEHLATLPKLLLAHAAISAFLVATAALLHARESRDPAFLLLVIATPIMGPIGTVGAAAGAVLRYLFSLKAIPFEQWYNALVPPLESSAPRQLFDRLVLRRGAPAARSTVASFRDVMALGTVQQKQIVLTAIADRFRPEFATALKIALSDVEPAVRVQAATVSARIENGFLVRSLQLEERREAEPDNPEVLLELAQHHDAWAATELLDAARARNERLCALDYYHRLEKLRPEDTKISDAIGRLLLLLDRPEQALAYLQAAAADGKAVPPVLAFHLECLYRLGRMAELRRAARAYRPAIGQSSLPEDIREATHAWANATTQYSAM